MRETHPEGQEVVLRACKALWSCGIVSGHDLNAWVRTLESDSSSSACGHTDGLDAEALEIDFTPPWPRISYMAGLREALGLEADAAWPDNTQLHTEEARAYFLRLVCCVDAPMQRPCAGGHHCFSAPVANRMLGTQDGFCTP